MKLIALVNDGPTAMWKFSPGDQLDFAGEFVIEARAGHWDGGGQHHPASEPDAQAALEVLWTVGNRMGCDANRKFWSPDVRSMSTGDVVLIVKTDGFEAWLCEMAGWRKMAPDEVLSSLMKVGEPHECRMVRKGAVV